MGGGEVTPTFYSRDQLKVIERAEWEWFFTKDEISRIEKEK